MEATLEPLNEPLIQALHLDSALRIAEIGCGGGGTALEIYRRAREGSVIHGFDLSPALIESARSRKTSDQSAIDFQIADAATFAPAEPYHRLVSRFGVMFFSDPAVAFDNLSRWLMPGGRLAFAVWSRLEDNPWMTTARDAVGEVVELQRQDEDAPGAFRYGDAGKLLGILETAGFRELDVTDWRKKLAIGGGLPAAQAADFALASFSSFSEVLAEAGSEAADRAHRILTARLEAHEDDGIVKMDACVHIVTGMRLE
jgi:SAM-dependent methyltransferase